MNAAVALEAGDLGFGEGLLALLRPALRTVPVHGVVAIRTSADVADDLATWCRIEHHDFLGSVDGAFLIGRGPLGIPQATDLGVPARADPRTGFAPRGASIEPGGPDWPFDLLERDRVQSPEIEGLYRQGVEAQWDAERDVPWSQVGEHAPELEAAVVQIMSFLAENELSALYVPASFLPRLHPAFLETAQLLAIQLADEARHIEVFVRRARLKAAPPPMSAAVTGWSLRSLLDVRDFTESAFLLAVLGEGTFLDLLRFVEDHAPDPATRELVRRARLDETRHVRFGLAHVRHALAHDATLYGRLEAAVRRRAATLVGTGGVPAALQDALTILAAGGTDPDGLRRGAEAFRGLAAEMHDNRKKRLRSAGFDEEQAETLSNLHTPNFM